jgi:chorismate mutase
VDRRKGKRGVAHALAPGERVRHARRDAQRYRQSIDNIDAALVFHARRALQGHPGGGPLQGRASGLPPADPGREEAQIARLRELAKTADLDPEFSEKFLRFIIDEVIRHHEGHAE